MKPLVYFFGSLPGGFSSYPEDHTKSFFKEFQKRSKNTLQIVVHREGNLLHYGYVRKFNGENYLGLCLCVDRIFTDVHYLFDAFDDIYATIVKQGIILWMNSLGCIEWAAKSFIDEEVSVTEYSNALIELLSVSEENTQPLPPVDFSIAIDHQLDVSLEMPQKEINEAIGRYPNVYIAKSNAEIERVTNFVNVIREKDKDIKKLQSQVNQLKDVNNKIKRQQKQYRYVAILAFVLIGTILGLLGLNGTLNNTKDELQWTQHELEETNGKLTNVSQQLKTTKEELSKTKGLVKQTRDSLKTALEQRDKVQEDFSELQDQIGSKIPLSISDIQIANTNQYGDIETDFGHSIYSSNTMYLTPRITYTGVAVDKNITLYVRLYTPSGMSSGSSSPSGYTQKNELYVSSGENTMKLKGWGNSTKGHWEKGTYRYEIWYNNMCLRAKTFTIY